MKNEKIVVPGGIEYRVLVLPNHKVLSLAVLEKVDELLKQGAQVIGYKPESSVSLVGSEKEQKKFQELANKIWGQEPGEKGEKKYREGLVTWGVNAREYLLSKGIREDFKVSGDSSITDYDYIHYTIGESHVYFVINHTIERKEINSQFRLSGLQPELWDASTGEIREAQAFTQKDGLTIVPVTLEPYGAIMVVFNKQIDKNTQGSAKRNYPDFQIVKNVDGEWEVNFDIKWGGPASVTFTELMDWTKHPDAGIKYYSGAAIYKKTFNLDFEPGKDKQYFLQLEDIKDVGIAEVNINGKDKGVLWTKPFRIEVTGELQKGDNTLKIKVVNSWYNRVAGDQTFPDKKQYTSTNIDLKHDFRGRPIDEIPLEPSGLLGPVTILRAVEF